MPRKARITIAGAVHHIMSKGIEGRPIFLDDYGRRIFLDTLQNLLEKTGFLLYAWCLMDNHYHLLIRVNEYPLGSFMRVLNGTYAQYFRKKGGTRGYLFQDRYKSIVTQDQDYIEEMVRYIHLNPVRAGVCATIEQLDIYPWTGHSVLVGSRSWQIQNTVDVLKKFSRKKVVAIEMYRHYLKNGLEKEPEIARYVKPTINRKTFTIQEAG